MRYRMIPQVEIGAGGQYRYEMGHGEIEFYVPQMEI